MDIIGRRYDTCKPIRIRIEAGRIVGLESAPEIALTGMPWVSPGFVDVQVNGCSGQSFIDPSLSVEEVSLVSRALDRVGVTRYCPTATTHSFAMLSHVVATIARACDESDAVRTRVAGIHLEGPYICAVDGPRGAHPREHVRPPDWDEFQRLQEAARGRICLLTLSPEYEGAPDFIARVVASGVVVAIGHTNAKSEQIRAAVEAGARLSTHLGNGSHEMLPRHPNYIWDQLAEDRLMASLIADGYHLPPSVVKSMVRAKTPERCILVSDLVGLAGMPSGYYENSSLGPVELLDDGRVVVAGQRQILAGATLPITACVANILRFTELGLRDAVDMASIRPSSLIGIRRPWLEVGTAPDLAVFRIAEDENGRPLGPIEIVATVNSGQLVFGTP